MISELFARHIAQEFPHSFTPLQHEAALKIGEFLSDPRSEQTFVLRGYAGTGKTSLVAAVVRVWKRLQRPIVLLAPTGRAAKVFSQHAGHPAYTIHKVIYREDSSTLGETHFSRSLHKLHDALFIVDEASMIAQQGGSTIFGTGNLMDDLIQYVFSDSGCRLMLVGDTAQLPPVGEDESPALQVKTLEEYGLNVRYIELTEVVRQAEASLVLRNATHLRLHISAFDGTEVSGAYAHETEALEQVNEEGLPLIAVNNHKEVRIMPGDELIDALEASYRNWGIDDTIVITRSNKRANIYNNGIRSRIFDREELLERGDLIMVVKNNYYWTAIEATNTNKKKRFTLPFIANGDCAEVLRLHNVHEMHGFLFADATLRFFDYDNLEVDCRLLLSTLQSESPSLTQEEANAFYESVHADYADITNLRERRRAIRQDPYYNALQVKYAYAITCHKSQGGQWHEVYIDQGYIHDDADLTGYLRWLYTAFTRTSAQLYLVNWPEEQTITLADE